MRGSRLGLAAALALCAACAGPRQVEVPEPERHATADGVEYQDLRPGEGPAAAQGARVRVHYVGRLEDGRLFDSTRDRGRPLELVLGAGRAVRGFEEGLVGMRAGGLRRIVVPPALAYGDEGLPGLIPPGATLVIEAELLDVL